MNYLPIFTGLFALIVTLVSIYYLQKAKNYIALAYASLTWLWIFADWFPRLAGIFK